MGKISHTLPQASPGKLGGGNGGKFPLGQLVQRDPFRDAMEAQQQFGMPLQHSGGGMTHFGGQPFPAGQPPRTTGLPEPFPFMPGPSTGSKTGGAPIPTAQRRPVSFNGPAIRFF